MTEDEIRDLFLWRGDPWGRGSRALTQAFLEAEGVDRADVFDWVQSVGGRVEPIEGPTPGLGAGGPRVARDYGVRYIAPADALGL